MPRLQRLLDSRTHPRPEAAVMSGVQTPRPTHLMSAVRHKLQTLRRRAPQDRTACRRDRRMVTTNATTCWSDTSAPHSPARSSARRPLPATKRSQVPATLRALNNPRSARFVDNGGRSKLQRTFCSTAAHFSRPDGPPHAGSRVRMALSPRSWHLIRSSLPSVTPYPGRGASVLCW